MPQEVIVYGTLIISLTNISKHLKPLNQEILIQCSQRIK